MTVVSAFVPVDYYDYRPANFCIPGMTTGQEDLTKLTFQDNSIESLSCMHTVEHIGFGRYGDPIDYNGDVRAMNELARVLKPGGDLLFVVPVGKLSLIQFNAHRIYRPEDIIFIFCNKGLVLNKFFYIPEIDGDILINAQFDSIQDKYGCGCFWFKKPLNA